MPSFDSSRGRFRLSEGHLSLIGHLTSERQVPPDMVAAGRELRENGLIDSSDAVSPLLIPLVETLSEPSVTIRVESLSEQGQMNHGAVVGKHHVFSHEAWPGDDESEYVQLEPRTLVWALARMVNLQAIDSLPANVSSVETEMGVLDVGLQCLDSISSLSATDSLQHVIQALGQDGRLTEPNLSGLTALIVELRSSWRMTAAWHGVDEGVKGIQVRGFAMWDCGPLGYWHRELPSEPILPGQVSDQTPFKLTKVEPKDVWQMILDMLPSKSEFATP